MDIHHSFPCSATEYYVNAMVCSLKDVGKTPKDDADLMCSLRAQGWTATIICEMFTELCKQLNIKEVEYA